jgi:hypothetical protein
MTSLQLFDSETQFIFMFLSTLLCPNEAIIWVRVTGPTGPSYLPVTMRQSGPGVSTGRSTRHTAPRMCGALEHGKEQRHEQEAEGCGTVQYRSSPVFRQTVLPPS